MSVLHGQGFWDAFIQCCVVYYVGAGLLHAVPQLFRVESVQTLPRRPKQARFEALHALGASGDRGIACREQHA